MNKLIIKKIAAYASLATIISYLITGYGIIKYQLVEALSLGLLTRALSFKIHEILIYPLMLSLIAHLYLNCSLFNKKR